MLTINEIERRTESFFTVLKVEELFVKMPFHERFGNQLTRNMIQFNNLMRKFEVGDNKLEDYINWHNQNIPDPPMSKTDFTLELTTYELLKKFFNEVINIEKLNQITEPRTPLKKTSTLGTFLKSFYKLPNLNTEELEELFDIGFRNALAHDTWYLDSKGLRYLDMDKLILIEFSSIERKIKSVYGIYSLIVRWYTENFFPEVMESYDEKTVNDLFPLYGLGK